MIEKPKQYYDTRRHQLYYQWRESEHYVHQEPIYDRTREYIESLEAENTKLRNLVRDALACVRESSRGFATHPKTYRDLRSRAKKLGVVE